MTKVGFFKIEPRRGVHNFHEGAIDALQKLFLSRAQDVGFVKSRDREAAVFDETFFESLVEIRNGLDRLLFVSLEVLVVKMIEIAARAFSQGGSCRAPQVRSRLQKD